jgi:hypothetical protein
MMPKRKIDFLFSIVVIIVLSFLFICACGPSSRKENIGDTVQIEKTIVIDSTAIQPDIELVTTKSYRQEASNFNGDQLSPLVAYNYNLRGLTIFEKADTTSAVIHILKYGDRIKLEKPLVNNQAKDIILINGFKGRMVKVEWNGQMGFVFSGYLLNYPISDGQESWIDYLRAHFHLKAPVYEEKRTCASSPDCDSMHSLEKYTFEQGIGVSKEAYYESSSVSITIPKSSVQEGLLLMQSLSGDMRKYFDKMPTKSWRTESDDDQMVREVKETDGEVTSISVTIGDGCSESNQVYIDDEGNLLIVSAGGC